MSMLFIRVFVLCIGLLSCKNTKENNAPSAALDEHLNGTISESDILNLDYIEFSLDPKTVKAIETWQKYYELETLVLDLKKADLSYFSANKDGLTTLLTGLKETIPAAIKTPSIVARLTALETKLLKLESISNLSTTTKEEQKTMIKEFLVSFSNLNLQMNKKLEKDAQIIEDLY